MKQEDENKTSGTSGQGQRWRAAGRGKSRCQAKGRRVRDTMQPKHWQADELPLEISGC